MIRKRRDDDNELEDGLLDPDWNLEHLNDRDKITLIAERQRMVLQRLARLEKRTEESDRVMQRGMGAAAVIVTLGAVIGWMVSVGKDIGHWFVK